MIPQAEPAVNQVRDLLFASVFLEMDEVKQTMSTIEKHPERYDQIVASLSKMMQQHVSKFENGLCSNAVPQMKNLRKTVKSRVREWKKTIGIPTMGQYVAVSRYWGVPVNELIGNEITPRAIYELLDCFVIGQEDYKRQLSSCAYNYLMKNDQSNSVFSLPKCNLLVCGPSGSGKTYGIQILARHFGLPIIIVHCNTLVQQGIIGSNITDYFTGVYMMVKAPTKAERIKQMCKAVVCFDEFDKLYEKGYNNETVRNEILSYIDDKGEIRFREEFDYKSDQITIPTKNMMFVFTGVFQGLDKIRRGERIGYNGAPLTEGPLKRITSDDMLQFGLKPEIVGRIQNYTSVERLGVNDLYELLNSKMDSPLEAFLNYFFLNKIKVDITDDAKMLLAQTSYKKELGARGMKGLIHSILSDEMFELNNKHLMIDREFVEQRLKQIE